jgi:hypothetical protein
MAAAAIRRAREQGLDRFDESQTGDNFDVIWVWETFIRTAGEDWTFYSVGDKHLLTDPAPVEEVYPEQEGERPITMGYGSFEAFCIFPQAAVESWQPLQQEANDVRNLTLDAFKQNVMPVTKVVRGRQIDLDQLKRRGQGTSIMVTGKDDVTWEKPPDVPQSAATMKQQLDIDFDDLAGQQNYGTVPTTTTLGKTLGGLKLAAGAANAVQEFDIRVWIETWAERALTQVVKLEQFYESDPIVLGLVGDRAEVARQARHQRDHRRSCWRTASPSGSASGSAPAIRSSGLQSSSRRAAWRCRWRNSIRASRPANSINAEAVFPKRSAAPATATAASGSSPRASRSRTRRAMRSPTRPRPAPNSSAPRPARRSRTPRPGSSRRWWPRPVLGWTSKPWGSTASGSRSSRTSTPSTRASRTWINSAKPSSSVTATASRSRRGNGGEGPQRRRHADRHAGHPARPDYPDGKVPPEVLGDMPGGAPDAGDEAAAPAPPPAGNGIPMPPGMPEPAAPAARAAAAQDRRCAGAEEAAQDHDCQTRARWAGQRIS